MEQILKSISSFLWGAPVLILLAAVGLLFGCKTKFFQFRKFGYILKNTAGEMFKKGGGAKGKEGTLTPLQAVSSALAGCVGTANIAGVATAMVVGGPGAVFWMWVVALLGMLTKCVEVTLGQYYRVKGEDGVYYGGPMYYIERGMGRKWKPLAVIFSVTIILGGLGTAAFAQPYTMSTAVQNSLGIPAWITTVAAAVICGVVLLGGVKSIGGFCEKLTPRHVPHLCGGSAGRDHHKSGTCARRLCGDFPLCVCTHARCGRFGGLHSCAGAAAGRRPRDLLQRSGLRLIAHHPCDRHHRSPL